MISSTDSHVYLTSKIPTCVRHWRNDYRIRKWCRQHTIISESDQLQWNARVASDPTIKMFSIRWQEEGQPVVGVCGLTSIDKINQKAEFSLYIAPDMQHKGFGRAALALLLHHGFNDFNLNRIWGESFDGNPAQKMFARMGMQKEGTLRESYFRGGKFIDSHIWAITRSQFNAGHSITYSPAVTRN